MDQELSAIISGVKSGKDEDFERLKALYKPLMTDMAKRYEQSGAGSYADLFEEAERALLNAALSYDLSQNDVTFGLYAKVCTRNALVSVGRANAAQRRRVERAKKQEMSPKNRSRIYLGGSDPAEMLTMLCDTLSPYEERVLREYFSGKSAEETAAVLGSDKKSVYNAVFRIRAKAKRLGEKDQTV